MSLPLAYYLGIAPASAEDRVLRELVELGLRYVGADEGSILLVADGGEQLVFAMTVGPAASEASLIGKTLPIGEGLTGLAAQTGDVQIGAPVKKDLGAVPASSGAKRLPQAVLAAPMHVRDDLVGVMTAVSFDTEKRFTPEQAELYARLANVAGLLVELRKRLNEHEQKSPPGKVALAPHEHKEHEIITAVAELVERNPERLDAVLALVRAATSLSVSR